MYRKIQENKQKGQLKSDISRELKLDPETVAKYYDMSEQEYRGVTSHTKRLKNHALIETAHYLDS
jgi:hypothetical protein